MFRHGPPHPAPVMTKKSDLDHSLPFPATSLFFLFMLLGTFLNFLLFTDFDAIEVGGKLYCRISVKSGSFMCRECQSVV